MEVFIEYVKQYPVLYNPEDKDYRDTTKKDGLWKRIVDEMKNPNISDIKTAKNEWKKLRDGHRESIKRIKNSTSGQAASPTNTWKYASLLEFLLPYMKNRPRSGNVNEIQNNKTNTTMEAGNASESQDITISHTETQENTDHVSNTESIPSTSHSSSSEQRQRKRKNDESLAVLLRDIDADYEKRRHEIKEKEKAERESRSHPLKLFFDSMSETAIKFPEWLQRDIKRKIFTIISEAEDKYDNYLYGSQFSYGYSTSSAQSTPRSQDTPVSQDNPYFQDTQNNEGTSFTDTTFN
ncbi:uncharacterized protein LOC124537930 [Vanessa cardui]|uniref:uncharacterized protein LOC124537930 n=1 Tax=Vanessa cardui TaxID=171605 RepID=UPI001F134C44|nr:uncharacterized protein LOC124537930 [Vanessa cardui]